jgi:hypothetical protein
MMNALVFQRCYIFELQISSQNAWQNGFDHIGFLAGSTSTQIALYSFVINDDLHTLLFDKETRTHSSEFMLPVHFHVYIYKYVYIYLYYIYIYIYIYI